MSAGALAGKRVGLHLTDRCQLDCDHCLRDPAQQGTDLPLDVARRVLTDAAARGARRVSLTGGEPTLHAQFVDVVATAVDLGFCWDMVTNGRRFAAVVGALEGRPGLLEACRVVAFSVDGPDAATHDAIRGPGQRREVLQAMAVAVAYGLPFEVTTALHARNAASLEAIGEDAAALGARAVRFAMTQPTGTALDAELALSPERWRSLRSRIELLAARLPIAVVAAEGWPVAPDAAPCGPARGDTLHVDQHGRLSLCCLHSDLPGEDGSFVVGDASGGLPASLLEAWRERRSALGAELATQAEASAWRGFRCNGCHRSHGRPHWTDAGVAGAPARRARWTGARGRRRLAVLAPDPPLRTRHRPAK